MDPSLIQSRSMSWGMQIGHACAVRASVDKNWKME